MSLIAVWIIRYGHILSAATWVGGYTLLAFVLVPFVAQSAGEQDLSAALGRVTITAVRALTYTGVLTIAFGLLLVTRTHGYDHLLGTRWGALILMAMVIAIALLGIGDGALRPALRRLAGGDVAAGATARRWALIGFVLTALAVGIMTGAVYTGG